jgi:hypothetical protein
MPNYKSDEVKKVLWQFAEEVVSSA